MPLGEGDRAIVREIAFEVATVMKAESRKSLENAIKMHGLECPAKKAIAEWPKQAKIFSRGFVLGLVLMAIILGGVSGVAAVKIIQLIF